MLAPGGTQRRNPCPICGQVPQLISGPVMGWDEGYNYLVCWPCERARQVIKGSEWARVALVPTLDLALEDEWEEPAAKRRRRRRRWEK